MNRQHFLLSLLLVLVLAACQQPEAAAPTAGPTVPTNASGDSTAAYPGTNDTAPTPPPFNQVLTPAYPGAEAVDPSAIVTRAPASAIDPDRPVPTPEPGLGTVTGYVVSSATNEPHVNMTVRLAQVFYNAENIGSFVLDGANSPGALTDINGRFIFEGVDAAEYVIVVGNVETNSYDIIESSSGDSAQVWEVPAGEITDVGTLRVDIPLP